MYINTSPSQGSSVPLNLNYQYGLHAGYLGVPTVFSTQTIGAVNVSTFPQRALYNKNIIHQIKQPYNPSKNIGQFVQDVINHDRRI